MKKHNKKIIASTLALALLATGTFAWQSFSQLATNEIIDKGAIAGGRLHDYFSGSNSITDTGKVQEVFLENYAGDEDNPVGLSSILYGRVRLSEYLEYGTGAGILQSEIDAGDFQASDRGDDIVVLRGDQKNDTTPDINDKSTWDIYNYGSEPEEGIATIRAYRELTFGGKTVYMPTFNQDNESLEPDVIGTLEGSDNNRHNRETAYDDYVKYAVGAGDASAGINDLVGEVTSNITYRDDNGNLGVTAETYTHYAKETLESTVISMETWLGLDEEEQIGPMWVYDVDGWAYWGEPIEAQTATGLLLNGIDETITIEGTTTYYAVHAEAQLATGGDWGDESAGTGMFESSFTEEGQALLDLISGNIGQLVVPLDLSVTIEENANNVDAGEELVYSAEVLGIEEGVVKWSLTGNTSSDTKINEDTGVLTVGADEDEYTVLTITATSVDKPSVFTSTDVVVSRKLAYITISGGANSVDRGSSTAAFTAEATNLSADTVTWSVSGNTSSSTTIGLSTGILAVNSSEPAGTTLMVKATSTVDTSVFATTAVTVNAGGLTLSGGATTVNKGASTAAFTATATSLSSNAVTWTVEGGTDAGTAMATSGVLTVGSTEPNGKVLTVRATSTVDTTVSATTTVTVNTASLTLSGGSGTTAISKGASATAFAVSYTNIGSGVTWSLDNADTNAVSPYTASSVSTSGVVTVGRGETSGKVLTVRATSTVDPSISVTGSVTVATSSVTESTATLIPATTEAGKTITLPAFAASSGLVDATRSYSLSGEQTTDTYLNGWASGTIVNYQLNIGSSEPNYTVLTLNIIPYYDPGLTITKSILVYTDPATKGLTDVTGLTAATIKARAGTTTTVTVDGVEFYVLAVEDKSITKYGSTNYESAALLWAKNMVTVPTAVSYTGSHSYYTYFHNRTTKIMTWGDSYMRTAVLPAWLDTMPTLKSVSGYTTISTGGYYTDTTGIASTAASETGYGMEITSDNVFLLSLPEFIGYIGFDDSRASASYHYWLRSAAESIYVLAVASTSTTVGSFDSIYYYGVRPALWIAL